ncbi:MAG: TlyA family RNA methyltransferase [Candidatus Gracilibacteria bacterium]|nr:TlyA family RNA methyltransferase [Candidatus Gracilibacteria bacterium]
MRYRLDELLVRKKLVETRSQARLLIKEGKVITPQGVAEKPGQKFGESTKIMIPRTEMYVGRGANKIKAAAEKFNINFKDKVVMDVGASTGGFTDFAIKNYAKKVYAIDVGTDQLAEKLKMNKRIINMEGTDIRKVKALPEEIDIAMVDLSYISLKLTLEHIFSLVKKKGKVICLFKPQFEAGKGVVPKDGVIKDEILRGKILNNFLKWVKDSGYLAPKVMQSPIAGKEGNIEYLLYFTRVAKLPKSEDLK